MQHKNFRASGWRFIISLQVWQVHLQDNMQGYRERTMAYKVFYILVAALFLAACQQATRPVGENNITDDYYLQKIDGTRLPGTVLHDGVAIEVRSGSFVINANGTCISKTQFVAPDGKEVNRKVHATYVVKVPGWS